MNIFVREMNANFKSLLIWCGAQFFVIFAGMLKYSGFVNSGVDIDLLMAQFPAGLRAVFGVGQVSLGEIEGFYAIFFLFFMLLAGIHAAMLGAVIVSKEERDHSADFLYTKPVSRPKVITAKLIAGLCNILILNLLTLGSSLYFISLYHHGDPMTPMVLRLMLALLILQVLFFCGGTALGAALKTTRQSTSLLTGILLGTFILSIGIDIDKRLDFLRYLTPFKYFDAPSLAYGGSYRASSLILSAVLVGVSLWVTYDRFGKRDLAT